MCIYRSKEKISQSSFRTSSRCQDIKTAPSHVGRTSDFSTHTSHYVRPVFGSGTTCKMLCRIFFQELSTALLWGGGGERRRGDFILQRFHKYWMGSLPAHHSQPYAALEANGDEWLPGVFRPGYVTCGRLHGPQRGGRTGIPSCTWKSALERGMQWGWGGGGKWWWWGGVRPQRWC